MTDPKEFTDVIYELRDRAAWIIINRPKVYNAFRARTLDELIQAFQLAANDRQVASIVLTGAGEKAFCTGGDQSAHEGQYDGRGVVGLPIDEIQGLIRDVPKPVIARVNGFAIGGGNVLATLCERDGRWRSLRQLVGPILDGSVELCSGNDLVDQAHLACLLGSVALVEEPDLARLLVPDMTGQEGRAPPGVDRTNFGANLTELGVIGGNGQIAQRCEHVAAANSKAVDPRDHGFWYVADQALDLVDR